MQAQMHVDPNRLDLDGMLTRLDPASLIAPPVEPHESDRVLGTLTPELQRALALREQLLRERNASEAKYRDALDTFRTSTRDPIRLATLILEASADAAKLHDLAASAEELLTYGSRNAALSDAIQELTARLIHGMQRLFGDRSGDLQLVAIDAKWQVIVPADNGARRSITMLYQI